MESSIVTVCGIRLVICHVHVPASVGPCIYHLKPYIPFSDILFFLHNIIEALFRSFIEILIIVSDYINWGSEPLILMSTGVQKLLVLGFVVLM